MAESNGLYFEFHVTEKYSDNMSDTNFQKTQAQYHNDRSNQWNNKLRLFIYHYQILELSQPTASWL